MNIILCEISRPSEELESYSPFCLKVHRTLRALGLPYTSRHGSMPAAHKAFNATGQVPVLIIDGEAISDSTQIVKRLLTLQPGVLDDSPEAWLYEELADTAVNGFVVAARWADPENWPRTRAAYFSGAPFFVPPLVRRRVLRSLHARDVTRAGLDACWQRFGTLLDQLDGRAPERGFWLGERLSVADLALYAQLRSFQTELTVAQGQAIARRQRLATWIARVGSLRAARNLASASSR